MATPLGDRAIRFARPPGVAASSILRAVRGWAGVIDVVVARDDVAAYFAEPCDARAFDRSIAELANLPVASEPGRDVELIAVYDGIDLDAVAHACGTSVAELIALHSSAIYVVETIGFAPGFAYLRGLHRRLQLPRRATPRTRVPAGSLAIAGEHTAVYPFDSPGGWHLIGRVEQPMFGPDGARLQLGDRVRFRRRS